MKFRKKPIVIEAEQWVPENAMKIMQWLPPDAYEPIGHFASYTIKLLNDNKLNIKTLEGVMTANVGDWIIRGVIGEFYPCRADIFEATYEAVNEDDSGGK